MIKDIIAVLAYMVMIVLFPYALGYLLGVIFGTAKKISDQIYEPPEKGGTYNVVFHDKKKGGAQNEKSVCD